MSKKMLWIGSEADYEGRVLGALIDASEIVDSVYLGHDHVLIWDEVDGAKVPAIPDVITWDGEEYSGIQDMDIDSAREYLDSLVGKESRSAGDWEAAENRLAYSFGEHAFGALDAWETTPTYTYFSGGNRKTIYLGEAETEYELDVLDSFNLDYIDYSRSSTNREYGGMGQHAILHKVRVDDFEEGLLWHEWSQWQGSELDVGYLLEDVDAALSLLENHPSVEEIREWLLG